MLRPRESILWSQFPDQFTNAALYKHILSPKMKAQHARFVNIPCWCASRRRVARCWLLVSGLSICVYVYLIIGLGVG